MFWKIEDLNNHDEQTYKGASMVVECIKHKGFATLNQALHPTWLGNLQRVENKSWKLLKLWENY